MKNNTQNTLKGLILGLVFLFSFGNQILAQNPVITDSLVTYQSNNNTNNDSVNYLGSSFVKNSKGNDLRLMVYGINYDFYLMEQNDTLGFVDSVKIQSPLVYPWNSMPLSISKFTKNSTGYVLLTMQGLYQYDNTGNILWGFENDYNGFESVDESPVGYAIVGHKSVYINNTVDSLYRTIDFINKNGTLQWKKELFVDTVAGWSYYDQQVMIYKNFVYVFTTDSIEIRYTGTKSSSTLLKIDTLGTIVWSKTIPLGAGVFQSNSKGMYFFGNHDTLRSIYTLDTSGIHKMYFNSINSEWRIYQDSLWMDINSESVFQNPNNLYNVYITVLRVVDSMTTKTMYKKTYTEILDDTITYEYSTGDYCINGNEILLTTRVVQYYSNSQGTYWGPLRFETHKFILLQDTSYLDSIENLKAKIVTHCAKNTIEIKWNTIFKSTECFGFWQSKKSNGIGCSIGTNINWATQKRNHTATQIVTDSGWYVYRIQSQDSFGNIMGLVDSIYVPYTSPIIDSFIVINKQFDTTQRILTLKTTTLLKGRVFIDVSTLGTTYSDTIDSVSHKISINFIDTGWHYYMITSKNGCTSFTVKDSFYVADTTTKINHVGVLISNSVIFRCYPNPSKGLFTAEANISGDLILMDGSGKTILIEKLTSSKTLVDVRYLTSGVYFYRFISKTGTAGGKMIIQQ